jgi:hypothetical protein
LSNSSINNTSDDINRGFEFILRGGKKKQPKNFHIIFEKLISIFKREITVYFEFSFKIKKK